MVQILVQIYTGENQSFIEVSRHNQHHGLAQKSYTSLQQWMIWTCTLGHITSQMYGKQNNDNQKGSMYIKTLKSHVGL